jgi:hypothetical protein
VLSCYTSSYCDFTARFIICVILWAYKTFLRDLEFEVLTAVVMNVAILWDIAPCSPYTNRRFRRNYHLHLQSRKQAEKETRLQQILPNHLLKAGFLFCWFSTLKTEVIISSETSVHILTTRRYIPEDGNILKWYPHPVSVNVPLAQITQLTNVMYYGLWKWVTVDRLQCVPERFVFSAFTDCHYSTAAFVLCK